MPTRDAPCEGDLIPDPDHPGRLHTVDHVLRDGDQLRVCSIVGHIILLPAPAR